MRLWDATLHRMYRMMELVETFGLVIIYFRTGISNIDVNVVFTV